VRNRLEIYRRRYHATILLLSHNMNEVERLCDFVIMMSFGRLIEMSDPRALVERHGRDSLDEVFIHLFRAQHEGP
jgi:ABC-2 type transport system ATP-binding protein